MAPPVVLELIFPRTTKVTLLDQVQLIKDTKILTPYRIESKAGYVGGDRVDISIMTKCATLDGAKLMLGRLEIDGKLVEILPVSYRYSEREVTKVNKLPEQWWK